MQPVGHWKPLNKTAQVVFEHLIATTKCNLERMNLRLNRPEN